MSERFKIVHVDLLDGDALLVDLSDGTTVQITLDQILSHAPARAFEEAEDNRG